MRVFALILTVLALAIAPVSARGGVYLRVIADSDTEEAQRLKLRVRDAALAACEDEASPMPALLPKIARAANAVAPCRVDFVLWSPDDSPPAPTVRVTLGSGGGHNWWGILYEESIGFYAVDGEESDQEIGKEDTVTFQWAVWAYIKRLFGL